METIKIYTGIINNRPADAESFWQTMREGFKYFNGKGIDVVMELHTSKRSNAQNKYLWGVAWAMIADYIFEKTSKRFSTKEIHESYKQKGYFGFKPDPINPEDVMPQGSSECSTLEFNEAKERIQREWAERGLIIPDPQQEDFLEEE